MKFEVQTPVAVKDTALVDVSPCSLVEVYHFYTNLYLHL